MSETALAKRPRRVRPRLPETAEIKELADALYQGGLTPNGVTKPAHVAARIIAGMEVGLSPVQAINGIMVVNGRACVWGDAALALVRASGLLASFEEGVDGDGDSRVGWCEARRVGVDKPTVHRFSVDDAKTAKLWGKAGPWTQYPQRMLSMRPRAWVLRDLFPDVLSGLGIVEEQQDVTIRMEKADDGNFVPSTPVTEPADPPRVTQATLERIALARSSWLRSKGINPDDDAAVVVAWSAILATYGVESATKLGEPDGLKLLAELEAVGHQQEIKEVFGPAATGPTTAA